MSKALKKCPYCGKSDHLSVIDHGIEYLVECSCGARGPSAPWSREDAVNAWNALRREVCWTKEKPSVCGWYWHHQGASFGTVVEYVDPEIGIPGGVLEDEMWAGPIPMPADPCSRL